MMVESLVLGLVTNKEGNRITQRVKSEAFIISLLEDKTKRFFSSFFFNQQQQKVFSLQQCGCVYFLSRTQTTHRTRIKIKTNTNTVP